MCFYIKIMSHKYPVTSPVKDNCGTMRRKVPARGVNFYFLLLVMILISNICMLAETKTLLRSGKFLKLFKTSAFPSATSSVSLVKLRHKRAASANENKQQYPSFIREINVYHEDVGAKEDYDEDDNYDIIPDMMTSSDNEDYPKQPFDISYQISEKAKQVAESFSKMWQSLSDSVKHCIDALHKLFENDEESNYKDESDILQQEQQLRVAMEEYYRANEVLMNNYENNA